MLSHSFAGTIVDLGSGGAPSYHRILGLPADPRRRLIGLDVDPSRVPTALLDSPGWIEAFNRGILDATSDLVCAYKPNLAFYEALGLDGWEGLRRTLAAIPPDIPVIADAKRGDIGSTSEAYARALFEELGFDATTLTPYVGLDGLEPFLRYDERGLLILCKTSNPGSGDFQDLLNVGELECDAERFGGSSQHPSLKRERQVTESGVAISR